MARRLNQESTGHGVNELNERKRRVLWAVVQDYADTAEPVGSRTIARKYDLGVSSATIRHDKEDRPPAIERKETDIIEFLLLRRRCDRQRMRQHRYGFGHVPEDLFLTVHMIHQHVVDHVLFFRRDRSRLHQPVHIETISFDRRDAPSGGMRLFKKAPDMV